MSKRTKKILEEVHKKGYLIAVNTGRHYLMVPEVIRKNSFVDYYITSNGAKIFDIKKNEQVKNKTIKKEIVEDLVNRLSKLNVSYNVFFVNSIIFEKSYFSSLKKWSLKNLMMRMHIYFNFMNAIHKVDNILDYLVETTEEIEKFSCKFLNEKDRIEGIQILKEMKSMEYAATLGHEIEITAADVTKGSGIKQLSEMLQIEKNHVMAFGDSQNDDPMVEHCGYFIAMGNADSSLKQKADRIAPFASEHGVATILEELFLK